MKNYLLLAVTFTIATSSAMAATISALQPMAFDDANYVFTDASGLRWSKEIDQLPNGCLDKCSDQIATAQDSSAEEACEKIGGRLPTQDEVNYLVRQFDYSYPYNDNQHFPVLSDDGQADIQKALGKVGLFWTSTLQDPSNAYIFSFDGVHATNNRMIILGVRCVK